MKIKRRSITKQSYIKSSSNLFESSLRLLLEDITDVRGKLRKKIETQYIAAISKFKENLAQELDDTVSLMNSGVIKSTNEIKDMLDREQLKHLAGSLDLIDSYYKEAKKDSENFKRSLGIAQTEIETNKDLYTFLENVKKSAALQYWMRLMRVLSKSRSLIDKLTSFAPTTKEFVKGYIDILESIEDSTTAYISTLNVLKEKLQTKHTPVSPDEIESDEELREQFFSRVEKEVEKRLGRKLKEDDLRIIDVVMDVMKGDVSQAKDQNDLRDKLRSRDTEYQKATGSTNKRTEMGNKRTEMATGH